MIFLPSLLVILKLLNGSKYHGGGDSVAMNTLICYYDESKVLGEPKTLKRFPKNTEVVYLDNMRSLDRAVETNTYRLIVLVTYGFTIPSMWYTSRAEIRCPIVVMTGMQQFDDDTLIEMVKRLDVGEAETSEDPSSKEHLFRTSLAYIEENLYDHELSLDKVASHIYVSRCHYSRMFQRYLGRGFKEYVIDKRMKKANALLRQGLTVTEVCFTVGYSDLTHFARVFKRKYGVNPSSCRTNEAYYPRKGVLA